MTAALPTPPATDTPVLALARLEVVARTTPELIERVCRLLRHRGATVEQLVVTAHGDGLTTLGLTSRVAGDVGLLLRQLDRLADVRSTRRVDARAAS